jgi:hypothetical protein
VTGFEYRVYWSNSIRPHSLESENSGPMGKIPRRWTNTIYLGFILKYTEVQLNIRDELKFS